MSSLRKKFILLSMILPALFFIVFVVNAQSPSLTPVPPFGAPGGGSLVSGSIAGKVLDADGNPVSNAVVTLWEDGVIAHTGSNNPIISELYSNEGATDEQFAEGRYQFFGVYPGNYTLMAEKDGQKSSTSISVNNETVHRTFEELNGSNDTISVNLVLKNYHVPVLTPEHMSYMGEITGTIYDQNSVTIPSANVSLWQNGELLIIPKNPQYAYSNGTYRFEHIAPGQYQLTAEEEGHVSSPATVTIADTMIKVNITIADYAWLPPGWLPPGPPMTTNVTLVSDRPKPTPAAGILTLLLFLIVAVAYVRKSRVKK